MENLCYKCMEIKNKNQIICDCGYINHSEEEEYYLKEGYILNNRYIVGTVLGHGGFGITYISYDKRINNVVAIKEYFPKEFAMRTHKSNTLIIFSKEKENDFLLGIERFLNEAQIMAKYNYIKGIVETKDFIQENNTAYIIMEYLKGETLESYLINKKEVLDFEETINILRPIMEILISIHKDNILHLDISPDNIFMMKDGTVRLIDFGAAKEISTCTNENTIILKSGYAPIEQYSVNEKEGEFSDVYAIGATIYRMLTGIKPIESIERKLGVLKLKSLNKFNIDISKKQIDVINKAIEIKEVNRYKNILELKINLNKASKSKKKYKTKKKILITLLLIFIINYSIYYKMNYIEIPNLKNMSEITIKQILEEKNIKYEIIHKYLDGFNNGDIIKKSIKTKRIKKNKELIIEINSSDLEILKFKDKNLENYLKRKLNLEKIKVKDINKIKKLDLSELDIKFLLGLEKFTSLKKLNLSKNNIDNIDPILKLSNLELLNISYNALKDIENMEELINLKILNLSYNQINSNFCINNKYLESLIISNNNIEVLKKNIITPNLTFLDISNNRLENIFDISLLKNINHLNINNNQITNIEYISNLEKLVSLDISYNQVEDFSKLKYIKSLISYDISGNRVIGNK